MPTTAFRAETAGSCALATIRLHGDIDLSSEEGLGAAYAEASALDAAVILLDFADTGYINSTGIALIVRFLAAARGDHREVQASGLSPHYTEIFRITRLSDYVRIIDEPSAADEAGAARVSAPPVGEAT